jgi:hypothetical protein
MGRPTLYSDNARVPDPPPRRRSLLEQLLYQAHRRCVNDYCGAIFPADATSCPDCHHRVLPVRQLNAPRLAMMGCIIVVLGAGGLWAKHADRVGVLPSSARLAARSSDSAARDSLARGRDVAHAPATSPVGKLLGFLLRQRHRGSVSTGSSAEMVDAVRMFEATVTDSTELAGSDMAGAIPQREAPAAVRSRSWSDTIVHGSTAATSDTIAPLRTSADSSAAGPQPPHTLATEEGREPRWLEAGRHLWTGVRLYYGAKRVYVGELLGGSEHYADPLTDERVPGLKIRAKTGRIEWTRRDVVSSGPWFVRRDDPAVERRQWRTYEH